LLACLFGGQLAAASLARYCASLDRSAWDLPGSLFEKAETREREQFTRISKRDQGHNPFALRTELGRLLQQGAFVERSAQALTQLASDLEDLAERSASVVVADPSSYESQGLALASTLEDLVLLAQAIAQGALDRAETRGHHHRTDGNGDADSGSPRLTLVRADDGIQLVTDFDNGATGARVSRAVDPGEIS
jgi:succinate dehydrogenase/fumarate reductase flavoprotein subunit